MTMTEKYVELFYLVTFTDDGVFFLVPTPEIYNPEMAECAIPYRDEDTLYGITCYVTNYPNFQPIPVEILILQDFFNQSGIPAPRHPRA